MKKLATKNSRQILRDLIAPCTKGLAEELRRERDREIAKFGKRGPDRIASLAKWMHANFGRSGLSWMRTAREVRFFERFREKLER